ncbi:MAG TPA: hypothetical protein VJ984_01640 [Xanthomonadales bacterium]|nr:hypothetical protein [Xanthomonadales bacterium]
MTMPKKLCRLALAGLMISLLPGGNIFAQATEVGHPTFMSPHSRPIARNGDHVFVTNTPSDTVDVINADSLEVVARISVGIDPVGMAVRPDGLEVWVSNHVSDSVSVIDTNPASPTYLKVIATVQDFDEDTGATNFDEPVGIAFASNEKAYVALSVDNDVAVIDVASRTVTSRLSIAAQDPRALTVRDGVLYVIPFESNNQTQISGCVPPLDGELCTFDAIEHVVSNNNVLSTNITVDIVKNPGMPDRDLFAFDTATDQSLGVFSTAGTLLYGLAVGSDFNVYIAQADARNDANGKAGTLNHGLAEMDNRPFFNRVTHLDCSGSLCIRNFFELEPIPPQQPASGMALATPFAIQISEDDSTLIASAASSDKVFTVDTGSGTVLGRVDVGSVPRGIALESDSEGAPSTAWVLNAVDNTVSVLDVSNPANLQVTATVTLEDPTHPVAKRGRKAFHNANASTTGTFSCESCHPDGHTDQLLWVLDTPLCSVPGCTQIPPRITMPVRGLRDTWPFHWDGIPGDPYGGINTASITAVQPANCDDEQPETCTRNLVDGSLGSTMCEVGNCPTNDEGKPGALSQAERDDLAAFLLSVPYPPAPSRPYDNVMTQTAEDGFRVFHIEGVVRPNEPGPQPNVCGRCHRFPFLISTNSPGTGMDAPTWRGAYDRWLVLPQGRTNLADFLTPIQRNNGIPERTMWVRDGPTFEPVWNMITEGSTGHSGSFARQVTLNQASVDNDLTTDLLDALELSASEGAIILHGEGVLVDDGETSEITLQYDARRSGGVYFDTADSRLTFTRANLVNKADNGEFVGTFTGQMGVRGDLDNPQPGLWTQSLQFQTGNVSFPVISGDNTTLRISGRHLQKGTAFYVNGRRVAADVRCVDGEFPECVGERIDVRLAELPQPSDVYFLQAQNRHGLFSNDFIFSTNGSGEDNCPKIPNPGQADSDEDGTGDRCDDDAYDFEINAGISGNWYDPEHDGEGWFVEILNETQALVYWFTHTPPGVDQPATQAWIGGIGEIQGSSIVVESASTEITSGPSFGPEFDPERVIRRTWGKFVLSFEDCNKGVMYYQAQDLDYGSGSLDLTRLTSLGNLGCEDAIEPPLTPPAEGFVVTPVVSGAWFDPSHDGEGWLLEILPDGRALAAWFSYDPQGKQAWFYNVGSVEGDTITFELLLPSGADFGPGFDSDAMNYPTWGTVTFTFSDCNTAAVNYASEIEGYGNGTLEVSRLTQLSGLACP